MCNHKSKWYSELRECGRHKQTNGGQKAGDFRRKPEVIQKLKKEGVI
jgi:hypothetical protein